jgi:hypothetical protein
MTLFGHPRGPVEQCPNLFEQVRELFEPTKDERAALGNENGRIVDR